jgi:hypothetical protein
MAFKNTSKKEEFKSRLEKHSEKLGPELIDELTNIFSELAPSEGLEELEEGKMFALPECKFRHCNTPEKCTEKGCQNKVLDDQ